MIKKTISLTADGKKELERELKELIDGRPAISERIATARAFGDLSENEEYSSARNEQKMAESRILEIQEILKNAKVIRGGKRTKVELGASVSLNFGDRKVDYTIVPKQIHLRVRFPTSPQLVRRFSGTKQANRLILMAKRLRLSKSSNMI